MSISHSCILILLLVGVYSAPGQARGEDETTLDKRLRAEGLTTVAEAPLASKRMARLMRAGKREPQELARAWEQAATDTWRALQEAQKTNLDVAPIPSDELLAAARMLLEARLVVVSPPEDRRAALDVYRAQVEQIALRGLRWAEAGIRDPTTNGYSAARAEGLLAARRFAQESEGRSRGLAVLPRTEFIEEPLGSKEVERRRREILALTARNSSPESRTLPDRDETGRSEGSPLASKDLARQRSGTVTHDPRTVATSARQTLTDAQQDMQKRWATGKLRNGVGECFEPIQKCQDVELFLAVDRNERIAAFRRALERIAVIEDITERCVEWGIRSFTYGDLFEARAQRIRAEYRLAREREQ